MAELVRFGVAMDKELLERFDETLQTLEAGEALASALEGMVPDLLPLCLTTGLGWRVPQPPLAVLAFMGFEWQIREPLRVGDTIHSRSRTAVKRSMREGGVIVEEREVINQRGEVVQQGKFTFLVAKRPTAPAAKEVSA